MSDFDPFADDNSDLSVQEAKPALKKPPLFKVILLNDDFTPMDFVIEVLMDFFAMPEDKATQVMLQYIPKVLAFVAFIPVMLRKPR